MTITSRWTDPVPACSLPQWIFGSSRGPLADVRTFVDPERPATHFLSKADYRLLAKRIALGLLDAGLQRGDRVLVFAPNHLYYPALFVGILMAGGVFTGANPSYMPRELVHQLRDAGARFMVAAAESLGTALAAAEAVGFARDRVYVLDEYSKTPAGLATAEHPLPAASRFPATCQHDLAGLHDWLELVDSGLERARGWDWEEPEDARATCCLNYSSGTTGMPKGVEISHHAYVANCAGTTRVTRPPAAAGDPAPVALDFLPLYHAYGQTVYVAAYPHQDLCSYIMGRFDFARMLQHIARFRVTSLTLVPPVAVALAKHPLARTSDLSSIQSVHCGAAPLAAETAAAVEHLWPADRGVRLRQGWGMTELTCTCLAWSADRPEHDCHSVGELMPNCAARLVDVDAEATPTYITEPGRPGELWVSAPTMLTGYWDNPEATAATIYVDPADGSRWLRTGDVAYVDRYGPGALFYIVERRKELIKVKGNQVAPAELEALLLERPDVADAAVIGVPVRGEERPRAYIVRAPGAPAVDAKEIADWLAQRVAPFKRLVGGVVFTDAIPKNPSGKILRKVLREKALQEPQAKL